VRPHPGRPLRWGRTPHRYFAVDGGTGAHLLAALGGADPALQPVAGPRYADLLLVVAPVSRTLLPALAEIARALPQPAGVLIISAGPEYGVARPGLVAVADLIGLLPGAGRVPWADVPTVLAAADAAPRLMVAPAPAWVPDTIPLPGRRAREIATELAVWSLGPIAPFTAGPVRVLLTCDGEQVVQAAVTAGYAARGIAAAMGAATWADAALLARALDPLAPLAGQLAYVQAIEQLQGWAPPAATQESRAAALAIERAVNHLWWLVRFARLLAAPALVDRAYRLATAVAAAGRERWAAPPAAWIAPQQPAPAQPAVSDRLQRLADTTRSLAHALAADRLLALRTVGIGRWSPDQPAESGVSGPVLQAGTGRAGDVQARLLTRLSAAADDLILAGEQGRVAANSGGAVAAAPPGGPWAVPAGETVAQVEGPRGRLSLRLHSVAGPGPAQVTWQRPSAALLGIVPGLLAGQKLADAEIILASLDLAMAEADG